MSPSSPAQTGPTGINRAIIPAAGFGTRLRPLTQAIPKEMLPLGRKPVLEYVLEELRGAGIRKALFVVSPGKEMIRSYFGDGDHWGIRCDYVIQPEMKGLGDAVLQGEAWTEGEDFVVAFGDCLVEGGSPHPLSRVVETHVSQKSSATVLTERIAPEKTRKYGIVDPGALLENPTDPFAMQDIVEKPAPESAPSTFAVAARWALSSNIFQFIRNAAADKDGEVNLTDPVRDSLAAGATGWAVPLRPGERRRDIGGWETYLTAAVEYAFCDEEVGNAVRANVLKGNRA
jgi:UTP--glucose-1-phosphate uridylyltransferase